MIGTVYLLHFERPFRHARHYIGWTQHLEARLKHHAAGSGARLLAAVVAAGIGWVCARTWTDVDRHFERRLKNRHGAVRICPICAAEAKAARAA